jgi:hypothetical protein
MAGGYKEEEGKAGYNRLKELRIRQRIELINTNYTIY